ncbi:glucosylglycerol-phosphate synthase [Compostibacter hankyongensis]|uniref:Glucosylglycerol-phosphate synthase n=1 Tax=Compostibacter hankyongensis TaxID=1007089 RepID=A0ABP8FI35_9BACT
MMLLATDLDGTFLGGKNVAKLKLYRLIRENADIRLAFVTGRGLETVMPLLNDPIIPNPDFIISDVGATVMNGRTLEPVQPLQSQIEKKWPGPLVIRKKLRKVKGLQLQEVPQQRRCSYYFDENTDIEQIRGLVAEYGCEVLLSANRYLDILPGGVNKGSTLQQLVKMMNFSEKQILVAGDTLNDYSLYETGYRGVVVGAAEEALLKATRDKPHVYQAEQAGAGGILEAMEHFPEFREFYSKARQEIERFPHSGATQLVMLYHRLPYELRETGGRIERTKPKSPNGIIPSLLGFFSAGRSGVWIAWEEASGRKSGPLKNVYIDEEAYPNLVASRLPLNKKEVDIFYKVFSKEAFWPVIFSFIDKARFNHDHWEHYCRINRLFAERAAAEADHGAIVWVHEYNLWMVPAYLRQLRPDVKIGFFHHTAFPPADVFNVIPWRREIMGSLLQCDYVGFHIPRYVQNFIDVAKSHTPLEELSQVNCAERFLTYSCALGVDKMTSEIDTGQKKIRLGAHPVGVNVSYIKQIYKESHTQDAIRELARSTEGKKTIVSIERLDYVKGPLEKIQAFHQFLNDYPEFHGKVELINICTPPAQGMRIYERIQTELEQAVGKINGKYSNINWTPIRFFFRSVPFEEVVTYYAIADICWITPLRDGLNLVAKEYVAVQGQKARPDGVLIVSEFAGVSVELPYAIRTNPYDSKDLKESLLHALTLDENERVLRMKRLYDIVNHYDIEQWSGEFMQELERL